MRHLPLAFVFLAIFSVAFPSDAWGRWKLVWSDEFHGTGKPNPQKWKFELGNNGFGNQELQLYTSRKKNARVCEGSLLLEARKEELRGSHYSSARLFSRESWRYGRFEVRAKLPTGRGTWPAIWMLPSEWPYGDNGWPDNGEIDIMEHVGFDPGIVHGSLHMRAHNWMNHTEKTATFAVPTFDSAFHVYAVEWDAREISFFVDSTKYLTYKNPSLGWADWPFDGKFHILLNLAVGGSWGGMKGVDDSIFPQKMEVDYVRVYQRTGAGF